ncbi:MAG: hypothetical protein KUG82_09980 [Pseudomonadales bacterium]|nr:hypothetical protein [Pseudomonadales bacterium]
MFLVVWTVHRVFPESAPIARGAAYAEISGCVDCHGKPESPPVKAISRECSNVDHASSHPSYAVDCEDVMAYFEAIRIRRNFIHRAKAAPNNPLIAGERLVRRYHCFQCHGELGQGGFQNNKSLKGYVPGYFGDDFRTLTNNADPESVRKWISQGLDHDIVETPVTGGIAEFFFNRQAIHMPSYKSLGIKEIEILVSYVIALNQYGPMTAETVRSYSADSLSTEQLTNNVNTNR